MSYLAAVSRMLTFGFAFKYYEANPQLIGLTTLLSLVLMIIWQSVVQNTARRADTTLLLDRLHFQCKPIMSIRAAANNSTLPLLLVVINSLYTFVPDEVFS